LKNLTGQRHAALRQQQQRSADQSRAKPNHGELILLLNSLIRHDNRLELAICCIRFAHSPGCCLLCAPLTALRIPSFPCRPLRGQGSARRRRVRGLLRNRSKDSRWFKGKLRPAFDFVLPFIHDFPDSLPFPNKY
jgi:hypothetical protein